MVKLQTAKSFKFKYVQAKLHDACNWMYLNAEFCAVNNTVLFFPYAFPQTIAQKTQSVKAGNSTPPHK